jgi:hypothetical protein
VSSNSAPAAPDYSGIVAASEKASDAQTKIEQEQLDWAKQQAATNQGTTDQVVNSFLKTQDQQNANAAQDRQQYETQFVPLEDSLVKDASTYASPAQKDMQMGRAEATVGQQFDAARTNAARDLESFGIDPSATRYGALDIGARTQRAAATAGAGNQAAQQVDATGRALRDDAINVGRGLPMQATQETSTGLQAGTGAVNSGDATTSTSAQTMGTPTQWGGLSNSALNIWGNTLNQGYNDQLAQFKANNSASTGVGSALGLAASFLADGGSPGEATPGGAVPISASPSGGSAVDDVPSALTVGEFVMPKDVTAWFGQKHMYDTIDKARQQKAEMQAKTGAIPKIRPAAAQRPTFASRPQGAIPLQRAA